MWYHTRVKGLTFTIRCCTFNMVCYGSLDDYSYTVCSSCIIHVEFHESRVYKDWSNWRLNPRLFHALSHVWGPFEIDLFADRLNCQVDIFVSWKPDPAAETVDAFQVNWSQLKGYVFPPFALLGRCLV